MILAFQDRLRIPWRNGARQISADAILPPLILPFLALISIQSVYCTVLVFLILPIFLGYVYVILQRIMPKSQFFIMWTVSSVFFLWLVFEVEVVPMMEILPEENCIFLVFLIGSLFCFYKVKSRASVCHAINLSIGPLVNGEEDQLLQSQTNTVNEITDDSELSGVVVNNPSVVGGPADTSRQWICGICNKKVPTGTFHCRICQACIMKRDHHCVWLDCCIGQFNHRYFIVGLFLSLLALLYGSNLALTTVCHPYEISRGLLIPDDCSDVYMDVEIALSFVSSIYALMMAVGIFALLSHQLYLVSIGLTGSEYRNNMKPRGRTSCLTNWTRFLCCRD